jgi:very-short-patch-repair endonuclease
VDAGLAIELDGPVHDRQTEEDHERQLFLEANNIRVLRFTNDEILKELPKVRTTIRKALEDGPA